jgi:hypothetical protein
MNMMTRIAPEEVVVTAQATASPFGMLMVVLAVIIIGLGLVAYRENASSALALIGVFGGAIIWVYQVQTAKPYAAWALVSALVALALFLWDLFSPKQMWVTSWLAALIGIFGSFLSDLLTLNVDLNLDVKQFPLGVLVVIVLVVIGVMLLIGGVRRRRARTVVTTTTT